MKSNFWKFYTIGWFEFRRYIRLTIIWSLVISLLVVMLFAFFDALKEQADALTQAFAGLPPELLEAFGSDINNLTQVKGYFTSQFLSIFVVINSIFGAYLLSSTTGKELANTSTFLVFMKSIPRGGILLAKYIAVTKLIFISNVINLIVSVFSVKLLTSETEDYLGFFIIAFLGAFIMQMVFATLGMFISILKNENFALFSSIGLALGLFIVDTLSRLNGVPEFIKYLTPYYYLDLNGISSTEKLLPENVIVLLTIVLAFFLASLWLYRKKDVEL